MKLSITFSALVALAFSKVAIAGPVYQDMQLRQGGDVNTLLQGLRDQNLTSLADVLKDHPAVTDKILADDTPKYFLAPTNDAISKLPAWVTGNSTRLEATLLQHILRGEFDPNTFNAYPLHTVGHSLLNSPDFAQLPGGAGQAVALAKSGGKVVIAEAINNDTLVLGKSAKIDAVTVQPVTQAITVPGSVMETLNFLGHKSFAALLNNDTFANLAKTIDEMAGVTLFVPTEAALAAFVAQNPNVDSVVTNQYITVLGQHIVASRMVYSPLLIDQASMISTSGQDIVFNNTDGTVHVGKFSAKIVKTDIMAKQGVIHLIDAVLASTARDTTRGEQAQRSATASFDLDKSQSFSGPVSGTNSVTSQGTDVPASQDGSNANHSADQNGNAAGTGQTVSGIGRGTDGRGGGATAAAASVESIPSSSNPSESGSGSSASASASASGSKASGTGTSEKQNSGAKSTSTVSASRSQVTSSSNGAGVNIGTGLDHRNENAALGTHVSAAAGTLVAVGALLALLA